MPSCFEFLEGRQSLHLSTNNDYYDSSKGFPRKEAGQSDVSLPVLRFIQAAAGATAGIVNTIALSPLDVAKTRLQVQHHVAANLKAQCRHSHPGLKYRGMLDALKVMIREEGVRGYYRGLSASLWAFIPNWSIYWVIYEELKRDLAPRCKQWNSVNFMLSAMGAGTLTALVTAPLWLVKTRMQAEATLPKYCKYRSVWGTLALITKEEGFFALYRGLVPTLLGLVHVAVQFPAYEHIKTLLAHRRIGEECTTWDIFIASSLSKILASCVAYPHEVLRSRLQISGSKEMASFSRQLRFVSMSKEIYRKEGIRGFYRGFVANLARTVPACVVTFATYEWTARWYQRGIRESFLHETSEKLSTDSLRN
jgi:solute carrier family 25 folate transporter 32